MVSKDASLNLPLKCEALYLHLKGRRGLRMAPWQAPRKWLEAGPNANSKEFHGIPTLERVHFAFWIYVLFQAVVRVKLNLNLVP